MPISGTNNMPPIDEADPQPRRTAQDEIDLMDPHNTTLSGSSNSVQSSSEAQQSGATMSYTQNQRSDSPGQINIDHSMKIQEEHWIKSYWRPAMGWLYMLICFVDFVVFPALAMFLPAFFSGVGITMPYTAWQSLSLSNGGLVHVAFGAILGVTAWSRGQEKLNGTR
jgi:hypothetical protein